MKKIIQPAFGCAQYPKAGQNTQHGSENHVVRLEYGYGTKTNLQTFPDLVLKSSTKLFELIVGFFF